MSCLILAGANVQAQPDSADSAHKQDITEMLDAVRLPEATLSGLERAGCGCRQIACWAGGKGNTLDAEAGSGSRHFVFQFWTSRAKKF
jgi:hypothetical protein